MYATDVVVVVSHIQRIGVNPKKLLYTVCMVITYSRVQYALMFSPRLSEVFPRLGLSTCMKGVSFAHPRLRSSTYIFFSHRSLHHRADIWFTLRSNSTIGRCSVETVVVLLHLLLLCGHKNSTAKPLEFTVHRRLHEAQCCSPYYYY